MDCPCPVKAVSPMGRTAGQNGHPQKYRGEKFSASPHAYCQQISLPASRNVTVTFGVDQSGVSSPSSEWRMGSCKFFAGASSCLIISGVNNPATASIRLLLWCRRLRNTCGVPGSPAASGEPTFRTRSKSRRRKRCPGISLLGAETSSEPATAWGFRAGVTLTGIPGPPEDACCLKVSASNRMRRVRSQPEYVACVSPRATSTVSTTFAGPRVGSTTPPGREERSSAYHGERFGVKNQCRVKALKSLTK